MATVTTHTALTRGGIIGGYIRVMDKLSRLSAYLACALFIAGVLVICQMVFIRYLLGMSTSWQTEFAIFSVTAAMLMGSPYVLMTGGHVAITIVPIPLMLFSLGVRMLSIDLSNWRSGVIGAVLCPLSGVLMALAAQQVLQLEQTQFHFLLLFGALPPALLNYLVAERYNQEPQQVASIVLLSNIASLVIIPLTLAFIL